MTLYVTHPVSYPLDEAVKKVGQQRLQANEE